MKKKLKNKRGFTIIETMISVALFIIIVLAGSNALLNANLVNKKSQKLRSIMDNLSFIMEDMSRNLRTGYDYQCFNSSYSTINNSTFGVNNGSPVNCPNGGWAISFESSLGIPYDVVNNKPNTNDQWVYYISAGKIFKSTTGLTTSASQITPDEINIDSAQSGFTVVGATKGDGQQPFVTIRLVGTIVSQNIVTPFSLQTSVSQRTIDL